MTEDQINYTGMSKTNMAYMALKILIWTLNDKITARVNAILDFLTDIDNYSEIQEMDTTGATKDQNVLWFVAGDDAYHICNGLKGYYFDEGDNTNFEAVKYSFWDFMKCKKAVALDRMKLIHSKVSLITIGDLKDYSIVASDVTNLGTAIADFEAAQPKKRILVADKKVATAKIAEDIAGIMKEYISLDFLVDGMKRAQPAFTEGYHSTRTIYDLGTGHDTVELNVGPEMCATAFENRFEAGFSFLVRNYADVGILAGLSSSANGKPESTPVEIAAKSEAVLVVPKEAIGMLTRFLSIQNESKLYSARVTIIMSHEVSTSDAMKIILTGIPK